ncbi:MAG: hypothetical protein CMN30_08080 [Sandaracinus sp.]|nr:hypothetical protein [Sandaracinus sp.]
MTDTMSDDLHPESGTRLLFELRDDAPAYADYAVTAHMAGTVSHAGSGRVTLGTETVELELPEAPDWVVTLAQRFLRQIAAGQRGEETPRWPRRLLRWRAEP